MAARLPRYLPVEIQMQNFSLKLKQWKLSYNLVQSRPGNEEVLKQFAEASRQLLEQRDVTITALRDEYANV
jgi:hypothetical protein